MSRGRSDGSQKKRIVASICAVTVFIGLLYVYGGSIFGSQNNGSSALEYGKSLKRLGSSYLGVDDDNDGKQDESSSSLRLGDGEDNIVPKSFPVSCTHNILIIDLVFKFFAFDVWFYRSLH